MIITKVNPKAPTLLLLIHLFYLQDPNPVPSQESSHQSVQNFNIYMKELLPTYICNQVQIDLIR